LTETKFVQSEKAEIPILNTFSGMVTDFKEEQLRKSESERQLIPLGIMTEVILLQLEKAELPIFVTPFGMLITESKLFTKTKSEQPQKAESAIHVKLFGISTVVSFEQLEKAETPILITFSGIEIDFKAVHP
jgi:hypothetical protein